MKSKRANKHIRSNSYKTTGSVFLRMKKFEATKAVELAEEDARAKAIRAYCSTCCVLECRGGLKAEDCLDGMGSLGGFIKYYDNE